MSDGKVIIETDLDSKGLEKGIDSIGSIASKGSKIAVAAIAAIGTAITGIAALSVEAGSKFETSLAKASTMFGETKVNTDLLNEKILTLSNSTGLAATEIGDSLYNALSAGIPATEDMGEAMDYMEKSAKLAKAGFTDIDTAVTATAKVLNAYKMNVSETDRVHKILMQTQNNGITTVGELGAVLAQVTPTAAAMNVSFEQVGAALANMTAQGTPTAQATTQLNSLFAELGKQGTNAQKSLMKATEGTKYAGQGFQDLMASGVPLNEVLDLMGVKADASDQSLIDMFGSLEAGKAALALSGENAETFTKNLTAMSTETDVVSNAYEIMTDTLEHKSDVLKEEFTNLGIRIYDKLEEPLKKAADVGIEAIDALGVSLTEGDLSGSIDKIAEGFGELISKIAECVVNWIPKIITGFEWFLNNGEKIAIILGTIATSILAFKAGAILTGVIRSWQQAQVALALYKLTTDGATISQGVMNGVFTIGETIVALFTGQITLATAVTGLWTKAQVALSAAMTANPIGIVIALVVALIGVVIYLWNTNEGFRDFITKCWDAIKLAGEACWGWLVKFFNEDIPNAFNSVMEWFGKLPEWFGELWAKVTDKFKEWGTNISNFFTETIPQWIENIKVWFSQIPYNLGIMVGEFLATIYKWGSDTWTYFETNIPLWIEGISKWFSELPGRIWAWLLETYNNVVKWGSDMWNKASEIASTFLTNIINWFRELPGKVWTWLTNTISKVIQFGNDMKAKAIEAGQKFTTGLIDILTALPGQVWDIGVNIVEGLWNGITSMGSWIGDKVSGFFGGIVDGAKSVLGIHSPSRVFRDQVGKQVPAGMVVGIEDGMPEVEKSVKDNFGNLVSEVDISDLTAKMTATVNYETSKTSRGIIGANSMANTSGSITNNNENGITQNVTIVNPERTPSENARALKKVGRDLVFG